MKMVMGGNLCGNFLFFFVSVFLAVFLLDSFQDFLFFFVCLLSENLVLARGVGLMGEGENVMALQRDQGDTSFSQSTRLGFVCLELYFTFFLFVFLERAAI
ncbi:hypothetical protein F5882DRAFT_422030 [Hyaloscypha sp. PMI_1271]|nr:hypothetical protein F5882DRAFT_422030 [Hyaloscypha sp. PMI_1271]